MGKKYQLEFEIKGDGADAKLAIRGVSDEIDHLGDKAQDTAKGGLDALERKTGSVNSSFGGLARKIPILVTALAGFGAISGIRNLAKDARDLDNASQALGIGINTLSQYQYAFEQVNIDGDKTVDMFKDLSDKIGDFASTGAGPLKDIIARTNLDIRELIQLSPDQQLLKIYGALEDIKGITDSEMAFYLESLVSDATLLRPLLEDNAAGLRAFQIEGEALGATLDAIEVEKLKEAGEEMRKLSAVWDGFTQDLTLSFIPVITDVLGWVVDLTHGFFDLTEEVAGASIKIGDHKVSQDALTQAVYDSEVAMRNYSHASAEQRKQSRASIKSNIAEARSLIAVKKAAIEAAYAKGQEAKARTQSFLSTINPLYKAGNALVAKGYDRHVKILSSEITKASVELAKLEKNLLNLGDPSKVPPPRPRPRPQPRAIATPDRSSSSNRRAPTFYQKTKAAQDKLNKSSKALADQKRKEAKAHRAAERATARSARESERAAAKIAAASKKLDDAYQSELKSLKATHDQLTLKGEALYREQLKAKGITADKYDELAAQNALNDKIAENTKIRDENKRKQEELTAAFESQKKSLKDQIDQISMSDEAYARLQITQSKFGESRKAELLNLVNARIAREKYNKKVEETTRLKEQEAEKTKQLNSQYEQEKKALENQILQLQVTDDAFQKILLSQTDYNDKQKQSLAILLDKKIAAAQEKADLDRAANAYKAAADAIADHNARLSKTPELYRQWKLEQEGVPAGQIRILEGQQKINEVTEKSQTFYAAMADSFGNASGSMEDRIKSFGDAFVAEMERMLIYKPLMDAFFGSKNANGGRGGGLFGDVFGDIFKGFGIPGFATGGQFAVGGSGGTDSQLVMFKATPNERVTIETPAQQAGNGKMSVAFSPVNNINISGNAEVTGQRQNESGGQDIDIRVITQQVQGELVNNARSNRPGGLQEIFERRRG